MSFGDYPESRYGVFESIQLFIPMTIATFYEIIMNNLKIKTLLTNCRIFNPYGENVFIENGSILIEDGIITDIGPIDSTRSADEVIDLNGKTVLPGMINAHAHLYSTLATGMPFPKGHPTNFTEILEEIWWILDRALDEDSTRASFEVGLLDHLRHGVTTVIDHHSSPRYINGSLHLLTETAKQFGLNISGAFEMTDRNGVDSFQESLEENLRFHHDHIHSHTVRPLIGLHASFTLSDESLRHIAESLRQASAWGIHVHTAEDQADQSDAERRGYVSVIQRLDSFGLLNENSLVIHGTHFSSEDGDIVKRTGAMLVHNPTSNANNRVGLTLTGIINDLAAGLGTDGMQANMLAEAREGTLIRSSHLSSAASAVNYAELLFNHNPAIATRLFNRKIGKLDPGYSADLALYDYRPKTVVTRENMLSHILYGLEKPSDVMTAGIFRIRDNTVLNLALADILNNARLQSETLWKKMEIIYHEEH